MIGRIGKRLLQSIPVIFGVTFLTFCLLYMAPGDPVMIRMSAGSVAVDAHVIETMRAQMGLDKPFWVQYGNWLWQVLHGDLGRSYITDIPIATSLKKAFPYTVHMALAAMGLTLLISVPLGVYMGAHQGGRVDTTGRYLAFVGNAVPSFIIGIALLYVFAYQLRWVPVLATTRWIGVVLPSLTLALVMSSRYLRQIRAATLDELSKPYVLGLRARGIAERTILYRNVLKTIMVTIITLTAISIGSLLGGAVIVETIFNWPGLGHLLMDAISKRDYPMVQAIVLWMSIAFLFVNLLADISYSWFDPRIKKM